MFSKNEAKLLRQDFWTSFGKSFPRNWMLYNTNVKGLSFKFHFDTKPLMSHSVSIWILINNKLIGINYCLINQS